MQWLGSKLIPSSCDSLRISAAVVVYLSHRVVAGKKVTDASDSDVAKKTKTKKKER